MSPAIATDKKSIDNFINGQFMAPLKGDYFENINPATGESFARVAAGGKEDVDAAVAAAKKAFLEGPWPRMSMKERCAILNRIGALIMENRDALALAETIDTGKPISESRDGDIPRAAQNFQFFANYAEAQHEDCFTVSQNERHFAFREPQGVAGLITPWNLPLYLASWKIAPCLAMGNSCVLKPAEWTPYTAFLLGQIIQQAGLPEGVFNVVNGFGAGAAGEALTRHPDVRSISFTGETSTGKAIMSAASESLKKLSFELGGKGANILFADANLKEAIPTAVRAAYRNQGQICLAGSRLFVHESIYKQVSEEVLKLVQEIKVGNPQDSSTQMGSLISKEHLDKVQSYIEIGKQDGKLIFGGERIKELGAGNFLRPALITEIDNASRVCQEEIFGPVLPIIPFKTEEEVLQMMNSTPYGLSCSVWSQDANRLHRMSRDIKTGIVWINCWFARDLRTPFGGQKASGIGREGGRYALEFFSELKTVCYKYSD
ncbi:MAG: aldehyde dehydrogenase [Candidatus Obscuribacterales bacterium]|nr:aldehyde dehydrogenase [Candidatus Obscuribacterales bacterium]